MEFEITTLDEITHEDLVKIEELERVKQREWRNYWTGKTVISNESKNTEIVEAGSIR